MKTPRWFAPFPALLVTLVVALAMPVQADRGRGGGGDDDGGGGSDDDVLTLRLDDAIGRPGGEVALVLRTYAAKPIRQGRLGVSTRPVAKSGASFLADTLPKLTLAGPFARLASVTVFSTTGDATSTVQWAAAGAGQPARVDFASPSGTVNASDGPMIVMRYQLSRAVVPGETYEVALDPALTSLVDAAGRPVAIERRPATLTIRRPSAPIAVEAEGDKVAPGEVATVGLGTFEPIPLSGGTVTLRYDPRLVQPRPAVRMDPRHGRATFKVAYPRPGTVVVTFSSPDRSLNRVPGLLVAVDLVTLASAPTAVDSPVTLDRAGTVLRNARGRKLRLAIENGLVELR